MKRTVLAPIVVTETARRQLAGDSGATTKGAEVWAARTVDGAWDLIREETPGTPWVVVRIADKRSGGAFGTLRAAQIAIASGAAERMANRCQACEGAGGANVETVKPVWGYSGWSGGRSEWRPCACCGGTGRTPAPAAAA